jgi:hypothetical protein
MISVDIRDLEADPGHYIRRLVVEQRIIVTDGVNPVAELRLPARSPDDSLPRYAKLVAAGVLRPAIDSGDPLADWPTLEEICLPAGTVTALIDEDRGRP